MLIRSTSTLENQSAMHKNIIPSAYLISTDKFSRHIELHMIRYLLIYIQVYEHNYEHIYKIS